jgi:hypothetical protein
MTDPGTSAVEALRARLSETQAALAGARALAESRAEELRQEPTEARMAQRREAAERVELLDLQRQKLEQELRAAAIEEHRIALQEIAQEQTADMAENGDIWADIEGGERQILAALDRHDALMNRTRARTRKAREHHFAGQFGDDTDQPTYRAHLPSPVKLIERLGKLPARLRVAAGMTRGGT